MKISVAIMTYNEEANIGRTLEAVRDLADEIVVVDSYSTDRTRDIAASFGARVIEHPFESHVLQRAYSIEQASHDWVFVLDADELPDPTLSGEIRRLKADPGPDDVFLTNRLTAIGTRFIHHGGWHPDWKARLFRKGAVRIGGQPPHDAMIPEPGSRIRKLGGKLLHYSDQDIHDRIHAVNAHSTIAANHRFLKGKRTNLLRILFKPIGRFLSDFLIKKGFLDGYYGFLVARSTAWYVFLREVKLKERWDLPDEHSGADR